MKIVNTFFCNISNKYVNLNLNEKNLNNISIFEQNFNTIEEYIYVLNQEIKQNNIENKYYNFPRETDNFNNDRNRDDINRKNNKIKFDDKNLYNYKNDINNKIYSNNDINKIETRMNNNAPNIDYKSLEQRVFLLENELINRQNIFSNANIMKKNINYYPYNTQQNLKIFQNGILSEKLRPLSVKNSNNINLQGNVKIKKKKRKTGYKFIEDKNKGDKNHKINKK